MRTFPSHSSSSSRRTWGNSNNKRDKMGLLEPASASPLASPLVDFRALDGHSSFDKQTPRLTPEKSQFAPAYDESLSRSLDTTQPLSSPEQSFSLDHEPSAFRTNSPSYQRASPVVTRTPSPALTRPEINPRRRLSNPRNSESSQANTQQRKGPTRIARLASLFSSRAVVKNMEDEPCPSPPRSDSSSGYVGWPGTQDKRGGTVAMEQASYSDSEVGAPKSKGGSSIGEYNLAAAVVNASAAANSPLVKSQTEIEKIHRLASPMDAQVQGVKEIYGTDPQVGTEDHLADPWANLTAGNHETMSEVSTKYSKTSSAYFNPTELKRSMKHAEDRQAAAAAVMRFANKPQPPTEEALRMKDHLTPPHRAFGVAVGYRGLLEKTRDVPNLIDGTESEATQSSVSDAHYVNTGPQYRPRRIAVDPDQIKEEDENSDVFDGVAPRGSGDGDSDVFDDLSRNEYMQRTPSIPEEAPYTLGAAPRNDNEDLNLVLLGGGLTTIQTTANDFTNRKTASDFDENLTNSDYDQYGFAKIPGFNEMATAGKSSNDRAVSGISPKFYSYSKPSFRAQNAIRRYNTPSDGGGSEVSGSSVFSDEYEVDSWGGCDLQQYFVHPDEMKPLVKKFRKMSNSRIASNISFEEREREEDATKAFALMEMRSRIMEKDIERGLERRGGTSVVDDLVLTPHNRAAMRVRDATIVAKAWRDGATPKDVINTALLTQRADRIYFILRPAQLEGTRHFGHRVPQAQFVWEEVTWHDDLELSLYRCQSIGPRNLRGFEMFTIGDCQSILLKLCNQQCMELRMQLNDATAVQLDAEDEMKAEETYGYDDEMMTEGEMRYLTSMEEVKTISHKLVLAEKAFTLVRDRIEKLVRKYEALLVKLDNDADSVAPSSVITDASSYYSDYTAGTFQEEKEREVLARRAQRAELRAELAAREAMLAKQRARDFQREKETEIRELRQKLSDLQSESSAAIAEREHSVVLARAITAANRLPPGSQASIPKPIGISKIEEVKKRFRSRSAGRTSLGSSRPTPASSRGFKSSNVLRRKYQDPSTKDRNAMYRAVGEEMFQHLDFYERSLKAVDEPMH